MNCIIKENGNNYRIESSHDLSELSYEAKQELVKYIKLMTGFEFGYVRGKHNQIIKCNSYNNLMHELQTANMFNANVKLVIQ